MLHIPKEEVCLGEFVGHVLGKQFLLHQLRQHLDQVGFPESGQLATAYQLKGLDDKFHFTDAAGTQLHIRLHALAVHFPLDQGFHFPQRLEGAVVDVATVHEGRQPLEQARSGVQIPGHRAHLDQCIALPFPALGFVVALHGIKADGEHPTLAPGTQAHVHPEYKAVRSGLVQHLDQLLAQAHEKLVIGDRATLAFQLTLMLVGKNQVDVRGQVQLPGPQLAHGQHHQLHRLAVRAHRGAIALAGPRIKPVQGLVDQGFRQQ